MNDRTSAPFTQLHRDGWMMVLAVAAAAIVLLVTLLLPLGFDNDLYESMGWTLYAYHGLPYLASWDHNFPGIVFVHWASIALFGASDLGFRFFDYVVHIAMAAVYYRFLRNWLSPSASAFGVLLFALYYAGGQWGLAGQRDTYAAFLLMGTVSIYMSMKRGASRAGIRLFLMGVFCGIAFLMRPTYVFFVIAFLVLLWVLDKTPRGTVVYLAGSLAPIVVFLTPYAFIPGGLEQVYYSVIRFNLDVYSAVNIPVDLWSGGRAVIYFFAATGVVFALREKRTDFTRGDRMMLALLTVSALISPVMMGKYFTYHFEPFLLIAIGFAAYGFSRFVELIPIPAFGNIAAVIALALFAYFYYPHHLLRYYFEELKSSPSPLEATYERVLSDSLFGLSAQRQVIDYVNRISPGGEPVEYISIFPGMRWRLARPAATRFTSIVPLIAYQKRVPSFGAQWRREFLDTLAKEPPRIMIVSLSKRWWPFVGKTNDVAIASIPGFDSLLAANFVSDTVIGGYAIYRMRR